MAIVRTVRESDAEAFLDLCLRLDSETTYMMFEPGERPRDVAGQRGRIANILTDECETLLVAESLGSLVGFLGIRGGQFRRNRHSASIVIGVLQAFSGQGIGHSFFTPWRPGRVSTGYTVWS